jgi:hypothetical protein
MSDNYEMAAIISDALAIPKPGEKALDSLRVAARLAAAGYSKPRTITFDECESLPDGAVILTPGQIVFSKYDDWFKPGVTGWARCEEGHGTLKTSALSPDGHFPAIVIHEPAA